MPGSPLSIGAGGARVLPIPFQPPDPVPLREECGTAPGSETTGRAPAPHAEEDGWSRARGWALYRCQRSCLGGPDIPLPVPEQGPTKENHWTNVRR